MLPSRVCRIAAVRMYCTPTVCWVQPRLYTKAVVRSRPEFSVMARATSRNWSSGTPATSATISGVYRAKCRLRIWNTQRGSCSVSSVSGEMSAAAPPDPCASPRDASFTSRIRAASRPRAPLAGATLPLWYRHVIAS